MIIRLKKIFFFQPLKFREERCDVRTERREKFCYRGHASTHPKQTHTISLNHLGLSKYYHQVWVIYGQSQTYN